MDSHDVDTAIDDAVISYLLQPALFHESGTPLDFWLTTVAKNRVKDLKRAYRRFQNRTLPVGLDPALFLIAPPTQPEPEITEEACRRKIRSIARNSNELAFIEVRLNGGDTVEQAQAICGQLLDLEAARKVVNRMVNRLHKRGQRAVSRVDRVALSDD